MISISLKIKVKAQTTIAKTNQIADTRKILLGSMFLERLATSCHDVKYCYSLPKVQKVMRVHLELLSITNKCKKNK